MSNFKGWANQNYNQFNNYQQFQEQQHQYDNYPLEQQGYYDYQQQQPLQQQQPHQHHQQYQQHPQQQQQQQQQLPYYQQYNYPQNQFYPQNYQQQQQQQPPQHMMYNNYQNTSNSNNYYNNNVPSNHQLYQTPTPPMEQKIEMNPPSKAMTGYKRAAYKPYTPANYIKPQQPTGTSYSLAYPTYSSMPSYNPVIANQSMKPTQIETHHNNNNNNQHENQSNTGTFNNDNQNNNKSFGLLNLNLNPKATPYQRRGIPLNEQTRQAEPTPPIQQQQQTQNIPQQKETTYNQQQQQHQTKSKLIDFIHPVTLPKEQKLPEQPKPERKPELHLPTNTSNNNNNVIHNPHPIPTPKPKQPKQEETKIIRKYFSITESESQNDVYYKWPINYLKSFQNWDLSNERTLLNDKAISHLDRMKIHYDEGPTTNTSSSKASSYNKKFNIIKGSNNNNNNNDTSKLDKRSKQQQQQQQEDTYNTKAETSDMGKWGRKDFSEEVKKAEIFKKKLDEIKEQDPIKFDLTEYLNMLTVDNYNDTKQLIFNKIKDDIEHQKKFLEVLFQKAVHEKAFVNLYAKLCKDLDKDLPQKMGKSSAHGKKATSSEMRSKLIDKCREIFKIDNNDQLEGYIKVKDPDERESKIKKFILGNVNFIGELISIKLLSKNIVFQCIDKLFSRYDNNEESGLRLISLEGIVILTDKFGTLINKQKDSIEDIELKEYIKNITAILKQLSTIQKNDDIPGYVKYKIINLLEKKKNGWEETQFEKNIHAKGKDEVRKAYEESQRKGNVIKSNKDINTNQLEQEEIDNRIRDDLTEFKDFIEEGNDLDKYQWEIITEIYNERQNSIAEIMKSFIETCIDFVQNDNTLKYSSQYWEELIRYYGPNLDKNEKKEIIDDCIEMLETVNSISLDNPLLLDVWANILFTLNKHEVMGYKELNRLKELGDSDLKSVFEIMKKIKEVDTTAVKVFDKVKIVLDYKEVYDDVMMMME